MLPHKTKSSSNSIELDPPRKPFFHILEIEYTYHVGLEIKSTSSSHLQAILNEIQNFYPQAELITKILDLEDNSVLGVEVRKVEAKNMPQLAWWLIKWLSEDGWELMDIEYLTPTNIFYCLKISY